LNIFDEREIPRSAKPNRWFVRRGEETLLDAGGFGSKSEASDWIDSFGYRLDWRVGYFFHLKGDSVNIKIVDRKGVEAKV
jgi:hypothetical protein